MPPLHNPNCSRRRADAIFKSWCLLGTLPTFQSPSRLNVAVIQTRRRADFDSPSVRATCQFNHRKFSPDLASAHYLNNLCHSAYFMRICILLPEEHLLRARKGRLSTVSTYTFPKFLLRSWSNVLSAIQK